MLNAAKLPGTTVLNKVQNTIAEYFNYHGDYFHLKCSHNRSLRNGKKRRCHTQSQQRLFSARLGSNFSGSCGLMFRGLEQDFPTGQRRRNEIMAFVVLCKAPRAVIAATLIGLTVQAGFFSAVFFFKEYKTAAGHLTQQPAFRSFSGNIRHM